MKKNQDIPNILRTILTIIALAGVFSGVAINYNQVKVNAAQVVELDEKQRTLQLQQTVIQTKLDTLISNNDEQKKLLIKLLEK